MSLSDLDALLTTPLGKPVKKKRKKKRTAKQARADQNEMRLKEVERAAERARQWRLSAEPYETRLFIQRTYCANCHSVDEATISAPLVAYRDRIGRVYTQRADILPRHLPLAFNYTHLRVGACQHCAEQCCSNEPYGYQLEFNFNKQARSMSKALVPVSQTPQAISWIYWALMAEPLALETTQ